MRWHELLRCPRCRGGLLDDEAALRCAACSLAYPNVGGIPVLVQDPGAEIAQWRYRLDDFRTDNLDARTNLLAQAAGEARLASTRRRMETLRSQLEVHEQRLVALFTEAGISPQERAAPCHAPVAGEGTVTAYYHQIHRDWGWEGDGNDEAREATSAVAEVLPPDASLGRMLVLGAGAARLTRDLHLHHRAALTLALDLNPLPFLVARRLLAGETLRLFEFPVRPRTSDVVCVDRVLTSEAPPLEGLHLVFADGLEPPVSAGAFDTVLTPWFIDQVPKDLATLLPVIHRALAEGGRWINFGPLIYQPGHTRLVHRYCYDELFELCALEGFEVERQEVRRMRYMESPVGSQGRTETVITFSARKIGAGSGHPGPAKPSWLADPTQPVPRFDGLEGYQAPHPLFAAVAALVDGQRSAQQIAELLVDQHGLPREHAGGAVEAALKMIAETLGVAH